MWVIVSRRDQVVGDVLRQVLEVQDLGDPQRHERLAVGQRQGRLEDADDLEVRLADPDRAADLGRVLAGQIGAEDDHVLALVGRRQRPSRRVLVRELVATAIGPRDVADHLVGEADLVTQVIDHRLDLAVRHIDAIR